jgi:hypothetical protein
MQCHGRVLALTCRHREHPVFIDLLAHCLVIDFARWEPHACWIMLVLCMVAEPPIADQAPALRSELGADFHAIAAQCSRIHPQAEGPERGHMVTNIHPDTPFMAPGESEARRAGDGAELQRIEAQLGVPLVQVGVGQL